LGLAAWPVFLIARDLLRDERLAAVLSTAFLLHPALAWVAQEQFHPDAVEVPLVLFALWFMLRRRWVGFSVFVGLVLLVKEDVPLLIFMLGLYVALRYSRKVGLITAGVSVAYLLLAVYVILPHFNGVGSLNAWRIPFGGIGGLLKTAFTDPGQLLSYLVSEGRPWYPWHLLAPLALAPLLAPGVLFIALGPFVVNLLANFWYQHSIQYHYTAPILPVLALAAVAGVAVVRRVRLRACLVTLVLGAAVAGSLVWGTPAVGAPHGGAGEAPTGSAMEEAIEVIPADASVSAYYRYVTHLAHREEIYGFPNPFRASYWGIHDREGKRLPQADTVEYVILPRLAEPEIAPTVAEELAANFTVIHDSGGVLVLQRNEDPSPAPSG